MLTDSQYEFPHDQVREVILKQLSPLRKRTLHLKAMEALLAVNGEKPELASIFATIANRRVKITGHLNSGSKPGSLPAHAFQKRTLIMPTGRQAA